MEKSTVDMKTMKTGVVCVSCEVQNQPVRSDQN